MSTFVQTHPERSPWGTDDAFRRPAGFPPLNKIRKTLDKRIGDAVRAVLRDADDGGDAPRSISVAAARLRDLLLHTDNDVLFVTDVTLGLNAACAVEALLLNTHVVRHVFFQHVAFQPRDVFKHVCSGVSGSHMLLSFTFDECGLTDDDFDVLAQAVARSERAGSSLASASLRGNAFQDPSFAFQIFARTTPALSALDLDDNARLGDACLPQLTAELSAQWMGLKHLSMRNCGFTQQGVRDLRAAWDSRPLTISTIDHFLFL